MAQKLDPLPAPDSVSIEPLGLHDRAAFSCTEPALTAYFTGEQVIREQQAGITKAFVLVEEGQREVLGFFTLSSSAILREDLPRKYKLHGMYANVPVTLLGRMALHERVAGQGKGLGADLLFAAFAAACRATDYVASYAVIVDAKNEKLAEWYTKHELTPFPSQPLRLFITMNHIQDLLHPTSG